MFRIHGPTGEDASGDALTSSDVPRVPNGKEGRVHLTRPLAPSTLATRIVGTAAMGVVRSIAIGQCTSVLGKDLLKAACIRPTLPSGTQGTGSDASAFGPFTRLRHGNASKALRTSTTSLTSVRQEVVRREVREVADVAKHTSPLAQDAWFNPLVIPSVSEVLALAVRVPSYTASHLLSYGDHQETDEVW